MPSPIEIPFRAPLDGAKWSRQQAEARMRRLLDVTVEKEKAIADRDAEVATAEKKWAPTIERTSREVAVIEAQLEQFFRGPGRKLCAPGGSSLQLACGVIGIEKASQPSLVPLTDKWSWEKIGVTLRRVYKSRFFHAPKPPAPDKVKLKKELTTEELAKVGLKLELGETFYVDLARLKGAA